LNKSRSSISLFTFVVVLFTIGFAPYLTQDAYAVFSPLTSAVANDPNDADTVYSVGDTIAITFPVPTNSSASGTMSNTEFRANFTVATTDIDTADIVTGVWTSTSLLTLTIDTITGSDPPTINTDSVSYDVSNGNIGYANNTEFAGSAVTLTGDFGLFIGVPRGGGCDGDCDEPTLGVNNRGIRLVDNGFFIQW